MTRDSATWAAFAHDLNRAGAMARRVGLRLGYHNHNWEFFRLTDDPSRTAFDVLIDETDPRYVHFELDLFWSWRGAHDPVDILRRIDGRVRQYHVKDLNQAGSFADPGEGLIDFVRIFRPSGSTSTSWSATTRARRPGPRPTPSHREGGLRVPGELEPAQAQIGRRRGWSPGAGDGSGVVRISNAELSCPMVVYRQ